MITKDPGLNIDTYFGLSSDNKPAGDYIKNGSIYYCIDNGEMFMYNKQAKLWVEQ